MPGYLRPHIQTILPKPNDQRQNQEGSPGWYWVELTFQPNPILFSEAEQVSLREGYIGDSLLILSDPLPIDEDRKHIVTVKAQPDTFEYFVYCNQKGRLSHINFRYHTSCFAEAIRVAREKIQPFLSGWAVRFNVPLYVFRIRTLEESTNVVRTIFYHQLYSPVHVSSAETNRLYWFPGDIRIINFYHDALNATSPSYQFLCYFKVIELVLGLRGKRAAEAKQKGSVRIRQRDVFPDEDWINLHLPAELAADLVGKKFTYIHSEILRPIRNQIAHALLEDDGSTVSDEDIYPYLPVAKLMAEQLMTAELVEQAS